MVYSHVLEFNELIELWAETGDVSADQRRRRENRTILRRSFGRNGESNLGLLRTCKSTPKLPSCSTARTSSVSQASTVTWRRGPLCPRSDVIISTSSRASRYPCPSGPSAAACTARTGTRIMGAASTNYTIACHFLTLRSRSETCTGIRV
jgi:hypothetical protein